MHQFTLSKILGFLVLITLTAISHNAMATSPAQPHSLGATQYHYRAVTGVKMFDQEAEGAGTPVIVLLRGFPPFSHMYRALISLLIGKFYVIAPDYPQRI